MQSVAGIISGKEKNFIASSRSGLPTMRGKFCTASTQICFPFFVDWIVSVYSAVELLSCLDHHLAVGKSGGSSVIQSPPILPTEDRVSAQNPIRINCARWAGQVHYESIRFPSPIGLATASRRRRLPVARASGLSVRRTATGYRTDGRRNCHLAPSTDADHYRAEA